MTDFEKEYKEDAMSELYHGIEITRFCFDRRKKGISRPACCKKEVCPGPEECGDPMYLLDDNTFIDLYTKQGVPFPSPNP